MLTHYLINLIYPTYIDNLIVLNEAPIESTQNFPTIPMLYLWDLLLLSVLKIILTITRAFTGN